MRESIWLRWTEFKHNFLFDYSFKYRQALRVIELQEEKIQEQKELLIKSRRAIMKLQKERTNGN